MRLSHYVPRTRPLAVGGGSTGGKNIGPSPMEIHHGPVKIKPEGVRGLGGWGWWGWGIAF